MTEKDYYSLSQFRKTPPTLLPDGKRHNLPGLNETLAGNKARDEAAREERIKAKAKAEAEAEAALKKPSKMDVIRKQNEDARARIGVDQNKPKIAGTPGEVHQGTVVKG